VKRSSLPRRGDVWWLESPEIGRRPVLVITRDSAIDVLSGIVVAPITRTVETLTPRSVLISMTECRNYVQHRLTIFEPCQGR
jgi:mRNA-degrading endonuclease toxin of MazEF toxin-antitoxin module